MNKQVVIIITLLLLILLSSSALSVNDYTTDLKHRWTLDFADENGMIVTDTGTDGTKPMTLINGTQKWKHQNENCIIGECYNRTPDSNAATGNSGAGDVMADEDWTMSIWTKNYLAEGGDGDYWAGDTFIGYYTGTNAGCKIETRGDRGKYYLSIDDLEDANSLFQSNATLNITDGNWHLFTGTYHADNDTAFFYVDGIKVAGNTGTCTVTNGNFSVGGAEAHNPNEYNPSGLVDDGRYYNAALTPTQVKQIYDYGILQSQNNFSINAKDAYNQSQIDDFVAIVNGTTYTTTTGLITTTIKKGLNATVNISVYSGENNGYHWRQELNFNASNDYEANLTRLVSVINASYNYLTRYGLNYSRNLIYNINYTCLIGSNASLDRFVNGTIYKNVNLTCDNNSHILTDTFTYGKEAAFNFTLFFNSTYNTSLSQNYLGNLTLISDLYDPSVLLLNVSEGSGFNDKNINITLKCGDNIMPDPIYNLTVNYNQILYLNFTNGTTITNRTNVSDSTTSYRIQGICRDLFGSSNVTVTPSIYSRSVYLINERNNSFFDPANVSSLKVYFEDNSTFYDFKANSVYYVNFTSIGSSKLRFEIGYQNGDIISRFIDTGISTGDLRICANTDYTQHFEQLVVSASIKPVTITNGYSNCLITEDYTRFAYEQIKSLKAYTTNGLYTLKTYDANGNELILASMEGTTQSIFNVDTLQFALEQPSLDLSLTDLDFTKFDNQSMIIVYNNRRNDAVSTELIITRVNDSFVLFNTIDADTPNNINILFDYSTLGINETDLLQITATTETRAGDIRVSQRWFTSAANVGIISNAFAITIAILLTVFGLTFLGINVSLGWFGILMQIIAIGVLSLAIGSWVTVFLQAANAVILIFIGMILAQQNFRSVT